MILRNKGFNPPVNFFRFWFEKTIPGTILLELHTLHRKYSYFKSNNTIFEVELGC